MEINDCVAKNCSNQIKCKIKVWLLMMFGYHLFQFIKTKGDKHDNLHTWFWKQWGRD